MMNKKIYVISGLTVFALVGCLSDKIGEAKNQKVRKTSWTSEFIFQEGLQVQIEAVSYHYKRNNTLPFILRIKNNTNKTISFEADAGFPVLHGEIEVICPDGESAFTTSGCNKKHDTEKISFAIGEIKEFKVFLLSQCGKRLRSYPVAGTKFSTSSVIMPGVYTIKLGSCEPIEIEVKDEVDANKRVHYD